MSQHPIPFIFMRGGTSRGPYMNRSDLPEDRESLSKVLVAALGSGHPLNIDGIGGGNPVTTKVAMLSKSDDEWADVDYFFAQVSVQDGLVDFKPSCGNILVGVGPAALEMGLLPITGNVTDVRIRAVNTGARILAKVQCRDGKVTYEGETGIDGVPGTHAPVELMFQDVVGGLTGALFPTGERKERIDGVEVTCMDVAMPMVIARAEDFGLTGQESSEELDADRAFFQRMEAIRLEAGQRMGLGDVTKSVTPKFGLLAPAKNGGTAATRYFMPWTTHPSLALTGSQCLSACLMCPGTVGEGIAQGVIGSPAKLSLEHPMGALEVLFDYCIDGDDFAVKSAGLTRTARKLAQGQLFVPKSVWDGEL